MLILCAYVTYKALETPLDYDFFYYPLRPLVFIVRLVIRNWVERHNLAKKQINISWQIWNRKSYIKKLSVTVSPTILSKQNGLLLKCTEQYVLGPLLSAFNAFNNLVQCESIHSYSHYRSDENQTLMLVHITRIIHEKI